MRHKAKALQLNYNRREQSKNIQKNEIIHQQNERLKKNEKQKNNIFSIQMHDYISSHNELRTLIKKEMDDKKIKGTLGKKGKDEDQFDSLLKKQLKRPIGAIADDIQEFINKGMDEYISDTVALAGDLLKQRTKEEKNMELRSDEEILSAVRFHAENKILNCSTPQQIRGPEALTDVNATDNIKQVYYLLENLQNVCVYGQGSQMYCLRNYVVEKMREDHLIFEMLGFMKKAVFRNMITNFLNQAAQDPQKTFDGVFVNKYSQEIVKMKKPKISSCFKYLKLVLAKMNVKSLFVIYKLEHLLEREKDFLEEFLHLVEDSQTKILFTIENFQVFWKNIRPATLNKLMVNFIPIHTFETQTFELESLNLTFNVNSSMNNFYSFLAIFSSFNDTMKEFLFFILLKFADEKKREFRTDFLYKKLSDEMITNSRNQFSLYLKEPLDHGILEVKNNCIRHFYTTGTLNRIIRKVLKLEPKLSERHCDIVNGLNLNDSDSEEEEITNRIKEEEKEDKYSDTMSDEEMEDEEENEEEEDEEDELSDNSNLDGW
jgi:hypothetical protein